MKLSELQARLYKAMTSPDVDAIDKDRELRDQIVSTPALSAQDRLHLYRGMHDVRLFDCLVEDYPLLMAYMGNEPFEALVDDYRQACPPDSFTLAHFSYGLPAFIHSRRDLMEQMPAAYDIARFEEAILAVFDAPRQQSLGPEDIDPEAADQWMDMSLEPTASSRFLSFAYDVETSYRNLTETEGEEEPKPEQMPSRILFFRHDFAIHRRRVEPLASAFLDALWRKETMDTALEEALVHAEGTNPSVLMEAFAEWVQAGIFKKTSK